MHIVSFAYCLICIYSFSTIFQSTPVVLHLLDIAPMMGVLEGVVMELQDCALPLLVDVQAFCEEDKVSSTMHYKLHDWSSMGE